MLRIHQKHNKMKDILQIQPAGGCYICKKTSQYSGIWHFKAKSFYLALISSLFIIPQSFANDTTPEINTEYLNELTGDNVTWNLATQQEIDNGSDIVLINGTYYKYTYNNSKGYETAPERLNNDLNETNTQSVVFSGFSNNDNDVINSGGAIYNNIVITIDDIAADFISNYISFESEQSGSGGAIYNGETIHNINADFIGNYVSGHESNGGAIYNRHIINNITGNFIANYVRSSSTGVSISAGALYNSQQIDQISANFIGNYVSGKGSSSGGAIYNNGNIEDITGNFIGNTANGGNAQGGAIFNNNTIVSIISNFMDNYAQGTQSYGGAIYNAANSHITTINGNFSNNYVLTENTFAQGGAIYNKDTIDSIISNFMGNYAQGPQSYGGAIYNNNTIDSIISNFMGNYAQASNRAQGGAIYNTGTIKNITADFNNNYVLSSGLYAQGGAIYNTSTINLTNSSFYNNYAQATKINSQAYGGAIYNTSTLNITADNGESIFSGNKVIYKDASARVKEESNAIYSAGGTINLNSINGGTIRFDDSIIGTNGAQINIMSQDINNPDQTVYGDVIIKAPIIGFSELTQGGANVYFTANSPINYNYNLNSGNLYDATITNSFMSVLGGTVYNATLSEGGEMYLDVTGTANNTTIGDGGIMDVWGGTANNTTVNSGGKIEVSGTANDTTINDGGSMFVNSGGTANNTTVNSGGELHAENQAKLQGLLAKGGALIDLDAGTVLTGEVIISADANLDTSRGFDYSQIFKNDEESSSGTLTLEGGNDNPLLENVSSLTNTSENKNLVLSSGDYDIGTGAKALSGWNELNVVNDATVKVVGDTTDHKSYIQFGTLNLTKGSTLDLAGASPLYATIDGSVNNDGHFNFNHATDSADDITTIKGNYKALANAEMTIDVNPITNIADKLVIEGDVSGRTKVTINPLSADKSTGKALFVEAPNDDTSTGAYFDVYRVIGDAHKWNSLYENNKWYVATDNVISESSPSGYGTLDDGTGIGTGSDSKPNKVINLYSEALAYVSLPRIGLEQTKDLVRTVSNKIASTKVASGYYGLKEYGYRGRPLNGVWIDFGNKQSDIEAPAEIESKIKSVDLGFDVQSNLYNKLGLFASYRQGEYELSGKGEEYYSEVGSDINIDSWTIGLYHRYDNGLLRTMNTIYGGLQKVDLNTYDGISADTNSLQFGGSIEAGLVFEPQKRLTIEPSVRLGYNFIKFDEMSDRYGKTAEYDNVQNVEVEAGVKVEKIFFHNRQNSIGKIFVKPSIIQNFGKGDVNITSLDTIEGVENETLVRGEIGASFNLRNGLSGYGAIGYTFGSDYHATDYNLGMQYNW